jgi:acetyl-CoA/propionyl-CoA carboxylase biotin carboxyl carrier protein
VSNPPFAKILIANRGEIAIRIIRSAKELGCGTVAVYSDADRDARHVRMADEAYHLGAAPPAQSYLNADKLLAVARQSGADALHPGYGFFAENAGFARAVIEAGLTWIGPHPAAIEAMGDKIRSRQAMVAAGVPVVPGGTEPIADAAAARLAAQRYGLPLALKASGGGGGKGLKIARTLDDIESAFATARREARAYFNNPTIYAERYLDNPKHVELQILADKHGHIVHVGERDCSLQRRHQKVWEEAPARISARVRDGLRSAGLTAARAIGYDSVGTIECLVADDDFFFLEMNTRIQVEHTISEEISGIDLVREQICAAAGRPLAFTQDDIAFAGHAIEVRINAEDPAHDFRPEPGRITEYVEPGGFGVRVDSAAFAGITIAPDYDSLIAKLIVWGRNRSEALQRLGRALDEYRIAGGIPREALDPAMIGGIARLRQQCACE